MDSTQTFQFFDRGPSSAARLVFFVVLSVLLMFVDARFRYLGSARSALSVLVSPIQRLAAMPNVLWQQASTFFVMHNALLEENKALHRQHDFEATKLLQWQALQQENQQLRNLMGLQQRKKFTVQFAEVSFVEQDIFERKILINKGLIDQVKAGQVVMDDKGVVGQITRVYPWLSEVTLITEKNHAVPIQVLRNGLRSVIFGSGENLALRYMPVSMDVRQGDVLVTSGIGGVYPPGIPVAIVKNIERDDAYPFAHIVCSPVGGVDKHRFLMVLSTMPGRVARPQEPPLVHHHNKVH
ncbi:MAG: rod shape-determining protein MreC [Gallionella sp.]